MISITATRVRRMRFLARNVRKALRATAEEIFSSREQLGISRADADAAHTALFRMARIVCDPTVIGTPAHGGTMAIELAWAADELFTETLPEAVRSLRGVFSTLKATINLFLEGTGQEGLR